MGTCVLWSFLRSPPISPSLPLRPRRKAEVGRRRRGWMGGWVGGWLARENRVAWFDSFIGSLIDSFTHPPTHPLIHRGERVGGEAPGGLQGAEQRRAKRLVPGKKQEKRSRRRRRRRRRSKCIDGPPFSPHPNCLFLLYLYLTHPPTHSSPQNSSAPL